LISENQGDRRKKAALSQKYQKEKDKRAASSAEDNEKSRKKKNDRQAEYRQRIKAQAVEEEVSPLSNPRVWFIN
jgi:hypothetical protein